MFLDFFVQDYFVWDFFCGAGNLSKVSRVPEVFFLGEGIMVRIG